MNPYPGETYTPCKILLEIRCDSFTPGNKLDGFKPGNGGNDPIQIPSNFIKSSICSNNGTLTDSSTIHSIFKSLHIKDERYFLGGIRWLNPKSIILN